MEKDEVSKDEFNAYYNELTNYEKWKVDIIIDRRNGLMRN